MTCPRCQDIDEDQLAYLKSETNAADGDRALAKLRQALKLGPTPARVLLELYAAKGKLIASWVLKENCCFRTELEQSDVIAVHVNRLRRTLGPNTIITAWGSGYRLSDTGLARVAEILNPPAHEAETVR